jgi:hypothetical protein
VARRLALCPRGRRKRVLRDKPRRRKARTSEGEGDQGPPRRLDGTGLGKADCDDLRRPEAPDRLSLRAERPGGFAQVVLDLGEDAPDTSVKNEAGPRLRGPACVLFR